ncbi:hypothetical protein PGB90_004410 [Kerria lacca]
MDEDGGKGDIEMASEIDSENETDSSDDEAKENALNKKKQLLEKILNDKTDYCAYVELIQVLSSLKELEELRSARENFNKEYPLSPEMWISWIEDEKAIACTNEEKQHINTLFERALQDYSSIEIWLEFIPFSIELMTEGNQIESVRSVFERALSICGFHVSKGSLLWKLYREFEKDILKSITESNEISEEIENMKFDQKRRIAEIFRRQLSIPLLEMEKTYQELRLWLDDEESSKKLLDMNSLENSYKKALEKLSRILTFEENLLCSETDASLQLYQTYLDFEKNPKEGGNDPFRVRCLYERALTENPLNASLWSDYIQYLTEFVKIPEDIMLTCYRAIRNCPGEVKFWSHYMILMERSNKSKTDIKELLEKALQTFAEAKGIKSVWLSYIYYLKRQLSLISSDSGDQWENAIKEIRDIIYMAYNNLCSYYGLDGDYECELLLWWARFEAETTKDLERFRKIWTDILNTGHNKSSYYWLKYINMEWQYGDTKHMRKLCPRALAAISDSPKSVAAVWLEFESHNGSLDSFLNCQKICEERIKKYSEEKKKQNVQFDEKNKKISSKSELIKGNKNFTNKPIKTNNIEQDNVQRKIIGFKKKESPEKPKKVTPASDITGTFVSHDSSKDDRTVFVSNLDYTVTEDDVIKILNSIGKIEEFRLVRDFKGRSKGYGYLVFSSKKEARESLKLDRTPINQRPIFISECDPDKQSRKTGLRFNTGIEKNKLFVKGLPLTLNKNDLEKLFSPYGVLKDIRLVTYRNGHSKGLAYIEFENEKAAEIALLKTDGSIIEDKTISVAISNPPERKNETSLLSNKDSSIAVVALGGGTGKDKNELGLRGRGRTQLSFLPRVLSTTNKISTSNAEKMDISESLPNSNKKTLSNEEFRNMLFSNK